LGVAAFPWDPPTTQQPPPQQSQDQVLPPATTVPSNAPQLIPTPSQPESSSSLPQPLPTMTGPSQSPVGNGPATANGPRIKIEPGVNGQPALPPPSNGSHISSDPQALARERAMNNLNSKYGAAAAGSVSQLQAQSQAALSLPGPQRPQNVQLPDIKPPIIHDIGSVSRKPPLSNGQTDGADEALLDWRAEVARRREAAQQQDGRPCQLIGQLRMQNLRLEGGGLMLPLEEHEHLRHPLKKGRPALSQASNAMQEKIPQTDGLDDDADGEDEDAINSDLDDPDDLIAEDHEGEEAVGQVMLCTYDKVQRVKNKWKCTLKDGILTTGRKE
jgi:transcription initiation factor TFIIA large subunit